MVIVTLSLFAWFVKQGDVTKGQTAAFLCVALFELYQAFSCRSVIFPVFKIGIFKNMWLNLAVFSSVVIILASIYVPSLQVLFHTVPLSLLELAFIFLISSVGSIYLEIHKFFATRNNLC